VTHIRPSRADSSGYTHDSAVFARYIDEVIKTARHYAATGKAD
jgi:hypothetical protein